jgi:hypothetical protein
MEVGRQAMRKERSAEEDEANVRLPRGVPQMVTS